MEPQDPTGRDQLGSKYLLADPIGRGAMGVVYDATTTDGQVLAVKILRPELSTDAKTVSRFIQERDIFRRIDHPNVVRVHDLVVEGDRLGIVMEKVSGGDLRARIEGPTIDPAQSIRIAVAIAGGLSAIHNADVIHRDLKPANILLVDDDAGNVTPKISDFGVSRLVSDAMTRTSTTIGTPLYMAPEAADQRGAGPATDVYALGAILFEMLTGAPPFHQGGTFAVLRAHAEDAPPRVQGVPESLADLIDGMLAKDPAARPGLEGVSRILTNVLATAANQPMAPTIGAPPLAAPATTANESTGPAASPASTAETIFSGDTLATGPEVPDQAKDWPAPSEPAPAVGPAPVLGAAPAAGAAPTVGQAPTFGAAPAVGQAPALGAASTGSAPFMAGRAATTELGLDRVSRRTIEIGAVLASLAVVGLLTFVLVNRGGNGSSNTGDETVAAEDPAGPDGDDAGAVSNANDDGDIGQFDDDGDSGSGDGQSGSAGAAGNDEDSNANSGTGSNGTDDGDSEQDGGGGSEGDGNETTTTTTGDEPTTTAEGPTTTEDVVTTTEEVTTTTEEETTTTEEETSEPLTLTGLQAINITETSVRIVWQSSHCAISQITFNGDTTTDTGWPRASTPCWKSHGRNYQNLQPGTTYTVSARVADQEGRLANAGPITFTTVEEEETSEPLTLTGLQAINITETSVRIVWQSSHCAISQITFNGDTATDTGWPRASSPCWKSHGRNYQNLQPGTTYTVSARVADQEGRLANAGPITFTTPG